MNTRVSIQWTATAIDSLKQLPQKVRRGLLTKADELALGDPRKTCKPLTGPLAGYYRIVYSRYRAVFTVDEEILANGDVVLHLVVRFVLAGIRKAHDKQDIYRLAEKLVELWNTDRPARDTRRPAED